MDEPQGLSSFEELELRLSMLLVHQRRLGTQSKILSSAPPDHDYRPQFEISLQILQQSRELFGDSRRTFDFSRFRNLERRASLSDRVEEIVGALDNAETLAQSLLDLPRLSRDQFDSFGFFVCRWISGILESRDYSAHQQQEREKRILPVQGDLRSAIEDRSVVGKLEDVFKQLLYVLSLIHYTQSFLDKPADREHLILMIVRCHECAQRVLGKMEKLREPVRQDHPELEEVLEWTSSALRFELSRVLRSDLRHLDAESSVNTCFDRLDRATGILSNGFDQTVRQLLQGVDPSLDGSGLLEDLRARFDEVSRLKGELEDLVEKARKLEKHPSSEALDSFKQGLDDMKEQSFHLLYRRDRRTFEEFLEEFETVDNQDSRFWVHRFQVFLATLLGEVGNRSVLVQFAPETRDVMPPW